ncbi:MAG: hypothetical protein ACLU4N_27680 [Butyricimonas faecihominis]
MKPGEQSVLDLVTNKLEKQKVDVSIYTSWVSVRMSMNGCRCRILPAIIRWYDVQFVYDLRSLVIIRLREL